MAELITQKGEFQVVSTGLRSDIERRFRALLGLETAPTKRDWALAGYTGWLVVLLVVLVTAVLLTSSDADGALSWPLAALAISAFLAEMQGSAGDSRTAASLWKT